MKKKRYGNELHPLYTRWLSMTQRCNNPNSNNFKNYGARGITIDIDLKEFIAYKNYVEQLPNYDPINNTLDRIRNNESYSKGNLRWTSYSVQAANQRFSGKGFNKFTGVNWSKTHNRWIARVTLKGKTLLSKVCLTEKIAFNTRRQFILDNDLPHTIQIWSD